MDKKLITRNFSRYASLYDNYAEVQKRSAGDLAREFDIATPRSILEIGSGTGIYTQFLRQRFPESNIFALDISEPMVRLAKQKNAEEKTSFVVADAENLPTTSRFDLVSSAACFQWLGNFEKILDTCNEHIEPKGHLIFSIFGPQTFRELDEVLQSLDSDARVEAVRFPSLPEIHSLLLQRFLPIHIVERIYNQTFPDVKSLLTTIKYCGVRGRGSAFGPQLLRQIEQKYREKFGEIRATSQVFFCKGQKK
jgi:malonyl-CoA O-methyltransferase